jgi:signal peptidase I
MPIPNAGRGSSGKREGDEHATAHERTHRTRNDGTIGSESEAAPGGGGEPLGNRRRRKKRSGWIDIPIIIVLALVLAILLQTFVARSFLIPSASMEQTLDGHDGHGDHVLVGKVVYDFSNPQPGDVVVFSAPNGWAESEQLGLAHCSGAFCHWWHQIGSEIGVTNSDEYDLVKRVIAVGGQTVSCCSAKGHVVVDGKPLTEPYLYYAPGLVPRAVPNSPKHREEVPVGPPGTQAPFPKVHVPKGSIFVMGDNRNNSDDSRYQNGGGQAGLVPVKNVVGKARFIIWPPSHWGGVSDFDPQAPT